MRKNLTIIILTSIIFIVGCTEEISVDTSNGIERLVIDVELKVDKRNSSLIKATANLTLTTPYFSPIEEKTYVNNAEIKVFDSSGNEYIFQKTNDRGNYNTQISNLEINTKYKLEITYDGEIYEGSGMLLSTPIIRKALVKEHDNHREEIAGTVSYMITSYFVDNLEREEGYYMQEYGKETFLVDNEFSGNSNRIISIYDFVETDVDKSVIYKFARVTKRYYNYLRVLKKQTGGGRGGPPFNAPPTAVRGNIYNKTNPDKFPLGYFRVIESESVEFEAVLGEIDLTD